MSEIEIGGVRALELLKLARDERGADYIYGGDRDALDRCTYSADGEPSCMVGLALFKAGVTIAELEEIDNGDFGTIEFIELPARVSLTDEAVAVFSAAQGMQDMREPWGMAYDHAYAEALVALAA